MRTVAGLFACLCILACPKAPDPGETAETSNGSSTGAVTTSGPTSGSPTSTGSTGTNATSLATTGTSSSDTEDCGNGFIIPCNLSCGAGEICVAGHSGDVGQDECRPNPDGCVPTDPCSPACAALCGANKVCEPAICGALSCRDPQTCFIGLGCADSSKKCAPTDALGDGTWNGTQCVPIDPNPAGVGEPCTSEGDGKTGVDTCAEGLVCLDGTCAAMCDGSDLPCTDPGVCVTYVDFVLMLCEAPCDPLQQDCQGGKVCIDEFGAFACVKDSSGDAGQYGDKCEYVNACDPGLVCAPANNVPGCASDSCCSPYCDLTQPNCPAPQQSCVPWFADPPPGYEKVGFCGIP